MTHNQVVIRHFESVAASYQVSSQAIPWRWIREMELNAVRDTISSRSVNSILELGCGAGFYTAVLLSKLANEVVATDPSQAMIDSVPPCKNVETICQSLETLSLNRSFDLIFGAGVLEFLEDPSALFKTAARHATRDSRLFILSPRDWPITRVYAYHHKRKGIEIRIMGKKEMFDLAKRQGWYLEETRIAGPIAIVALFSRIVRPSTRTGPRT